MARLEGKLVMRHIKRTLHQVFIRLPDRYCSHCGAKGVYESSKEYNYDDAERLLCFHEPCDRGLPNEVYDADHTLPRLARGEAEVVDHREWVDVLPDLTPAEQYLQDSMQSMHRRLCLQMFGDGSQVLVAPDRRAIVQDLAPLLSPEVAKKLLEFPIMPEGDND